MRDGLTGGGSVLINDIEPELNSEECHELRDVDISVIPNKTRKHILNIM